MMLINYLKRRLYPVYRNFFSRAYLYEGQLKNGKGRIRCLFVDNDRFYLQVLPRLFSGSPLLLSSCRCWLPGLKRMLKSSGLEADICIANVSPQYGTLLRDSATYAMQTRVTQTIAITADMRANRRYRDRSRAVNAKIRKSGLTCSISQARDDFELFYHRMAKPLIDKFGVAAIDVTYDELLPFFERGKLLLVLYEGQPVAGVLFYEEDGVLTAYRSGLLDLNEEYNRMGAMSAWYLFLLDYARENGCRKVDFMRSLPFLNDGVYMTKQYWGTTTEPFQEATSQVFVFNHGNPETFARIIDVLSPIVQTPQGLTGVVAVPDDHPLTPELERKLESRFSAPGLAGLQILRYDGSTEYIDFESDASR